MSGGVLFRVRSSPLRRVGIRKLAREGRLIEMGRGVYRVANAPLESHEDLALLALRKPDAVVCLLSALRFHELTTESPGVVWMAIESHARAPTGELSRVSLTTKCNQCRRAPGPAHAARAGCFKGSLRAERAIE